MAARTKHERLYFEELEKYLADHPLPPPGKPMSTANLQRCKINMAARKIAAIRAYQRELE